MPTDKQLHDMQSVVDNFCLGKLRIAKDKLCLNAKCGGLALINLREFLISLHVIWFKRVYQSTRDNWRVDLCKLGYGNPFTVLATDISV